MSDAAGTGVVAKESDVLHAVKNIHSTAHEIKGTLNDTHRMTKEIHAVVTKKNGNG